MKKFIFLFLFLFAVLCKPSAQVGVGVYQISTVPVCWSFNGVDSSILAYWLMSSQQLEPALKNYLDASGQSVSIAAGGSVANGYCCCSGGGGGGSNVTVTDNTDGTYTIIVDTDTTLIDTRANSNPITQNITIGETTINAGDFVQNVLIAFANEFNNLDAVDICGDTVIQVGHGLPRGAIIGQSAGNGDYFIARSSDPDSFPVAFVRKVISADSFIVCNEGYLDAFTHGKVLGKDYFLQDDGSLDTLPDSDYNIFGFRAVKTDKAYFDIPELIVTGTGGGGGGGTFSVTASNGLNDADAGSDVDVELGGTLEKNTTVDASTFSLELTNAGGSGIELKGSGGELRIAPFFETSAELGAFLQKQNIQGQEGVVRYSTYPFPLSAPLLQLTDYVISFNTTDDADFTALYYDLVTNGLNLKDTIIGGQAGKLFLLGDILTRTTEITLSGNHFDVNGNNVDAIFHDEFIRLESIGGEAIEIRDGYIKFEGLPQYVNDAAADADATLPSGGIYQITGDRTPYIKP